MPENVANPLASFRTGGKLDLARLRQEFSRAGADGLVNVTMWSVQYGSPSFPRGLEASCQVAPADKQDSILTVYIAVLSADGSDIYCQGGVVVNPAGKPTPGIGLQADALTELYDPQKQGQSVLSAIFGSSEGNRFYFQRDFTLSDSGFDG